MKMHIFFIFIIYELANKIFLTFSKLYGDYKITYSEVVLMIKVKMSSERK